jgi:hypothetical protein
MSMSAFPTIVLSFHEAFTPGCRDRAAATSFTRRSVSVIRALACLLARLRQETISGSDLALDDTVIRAAIGATLSIGRAEGHR